MIKLLIKRFESYKKLGDDTLQQLSEEDFFWQYNQESNSVATIVKHLHGNMLSRWTNFLTEDGEKIWRKRDEEFVNSASTKVQVTDLWEKGWSCLFNALHQINEENIHSTIYIRGEAHSVVDAVLRQLAHYASHVGQIIYIAKMRKNDQWKTLSIARNKSEEFNKEMFSKQNEAEQENTSPVCYARSKEIRDDYKN